MQQLQQATVEVERLGELFLINKEQLVEADRQRQANREALSALRRATRAGDASSSGSSAAGPSSSGGAQAVPQKKVWLLPSAVAASRPSPTFLKHTAADAVSALEADQKRLEARIDELRGEQKRLTAQLADRGAGPEGAGEGLVRAMLNLRDTASGSRGDGEE